MGAPSIERPDVVLSEEIVSIIPAAGWHYARLLVDSGGEIEVEPIAGFALVRRVDGRGGQHTRTAALLVDGGGLYAAQPDDFNQVRLIGPGERPVARQLQSGGWHLWSEPGECVPGWIPSEQDERERIRWENER